MIPYLHVYACLLLWFILMLASLVLGFATLDTLGGFEVVWLHPTPIRPCLDVAIWDASPWCRLLYAYSSLFFYPRDALLAMLVCATCWLSKHLYTLAHMSMHESCLLMSRPCGHLIQTYIRPSRTPPFVCFLACLPFYLFACFVASSFAMPIMLICFMHFHMLCIFSFPCLSAGLLSLPLHVHTWSEDTWS